MAKKFVEIKLDKTRNMRLGMVAMIKIEKKLGKKISQLSFDGEMSFEEISTILWAGLVHEDAELTPEKVAELVDEYSEVATAMAVMGEAMQEAFGNPNVQRAATQNVENGTGT